MRCFYGLVAFLGGVALAAPAADFEYPEAFRQPKPSEKTHLRRALDPDHAANKVYPPDPEEGSPKTFDVWREKFRELYEKQRDGAIGRASKLETSPSSARCLHRDFFDVSRIRLFQYRTLSSHGLAFAAGDGQASTLETSKRKELLTKVFESWQIFHDMFKARELARKLANEAPPLALRTRGGEVRTAEEELLGEADGWLDKLTGFTVTQFLKNGIARVAARLVPGRRDGAVLRKLQAMLKLLACLSAASALKPLDRRTLFSGAAAALAPARLLAPAPASAVSGGGKDYAEATIKGQDFSGKTFNNKDFSGCDAVDTNFAKSKLRARFFKADLAPTSPART
ncbi:hypothetical protein JL720_16648 [Aureococcus anophagefferens]|nr:hypothetical protein JL720_16648 [Aureococcus anophagefferens]